MFGYVTLAADKLPRERQERYRAYYCGLCRAIRRRYGQTGRTTLSYDATFLYLLLSSLYEPEETQGLERCLPHPFQPHGWVENELADYCADMNLLLSYHKCLDDWEDERSPLGRAGAAMLRGRAERAMKLYPEKSAVVERCLAQIRDVEQTGEPEPDRLANLTGEMLGALYRFREDVWADSLEKIGSSIGRFVYLMDAYDDLEGDLRHERYNPFRDLSSQEDFEELCRQSLMLIMGECAREFETLPLLKDADLLRNILYGGCWNRYFMKRQKKQDKLAKKRDEQEGGA